MGGLLMTRNFPGNFQWCGPLSFNVLVPKTMLKESHRGEAGSSPLGLNPWVTSRCVLILAWTTGRALMSFTPRPRES